jgi:hypothetical protein
MSHTQYNGSNNGMLDCRHRNITYRLGDNGDLLLQYSERTYIFDTEEVIFPVRYYLIKHDWFVAARRELWKTSSKGRGQPWPAWPDVRNLKELVTARGQRRILDLLRSRLLKSEQFLSTWAQDVRDISLGQSLKNGRHTARFWTKEGPSEQFWEGNQYEQGLMRQMLEQVNHDQGAYGMTEFCLGSVSNWPSIGPWSAAAGSCQSTMVASSAQSDVS